MINIKRVNKTIQGILENNNISTDIQLFFTQKYAGSDFDPEEANYSYYNLNPITIRGYVREISPTSLLWRQMGYAEAGAVEILCEDKYEDYFRKCGKIVINTYEYEVFREATGSRALIQKLSPKLLKVVLRRK